ncbi:hypothetical protein ACWDLL_01915 [Streptomyces griseoincarnatus]|uniref:hypothetical protein n=1 Tax=Streptomyces sp. SMS_SU21 TaxID=2069440 RepID=UPI000C87F6AA|nr:hypothetical protein [Streptomyces sp. SMS_SU21]MCA2205139.1 hypothetical protein [Streptomyces sp. SMS_SU21]NEA94839.1 hypothetical protein [Actinospica acidiphila]
MSHSSPRLRQSARVLRHWAARPHVLFGGVYGAVLASSMVAALTEQGATAPADRLSSAKWLAVTAVASALAHGYAHLIARRGDQTVHGVRAAARLLMSEWPLVLATAPTLVLLFGAAWGWWPSRTVEDVALAVNVVLLFAWGLLAARVGGRTWGFSLKIGMADALLGLAVVVANALIK